MTASASRIPTAGDRLYLQAGVTYALGFGSDALDVFQSVAQVTPGVGTVMNFTIPSGESVTLAPKVIGESRLDGTIRKSGAGDLCLQRVDDTDAVTGCTGAFRVNLDVREGALHLPEYTSVSSFIYGRLFVADGAKLYLPKSTSTNRSYFHSINTEEGSEIVTETSWANGHSFGTWPVDGLAENSVINGAVNGVTYVYSQGGDLVIASTNNYIRGSNHVRAGTTMGAVRFGNNGWQQANSRWNLSSLGTSSALYIGSGTTGEGATFRYLGTGERVYRNVCFFGAASKNGGAESADPVCFDAGPTGGLEFWDDGVKFSFGPYHSSAIFGDPAVRRIVLKGDNAQECRIKRGFYTLVADDVVYPAYLTKDGTGTWHFLDSPGDNFEHVGVTAVADGTLKFDSIAPKGEMCSLGRSTVLTPDDSRAVANNDYVNYAFVLGAADGHGNPVFEYTGGKDVSCTDRPLVVAGKGGTLSASAGALDFGGISARDADSNPTITFGGAGTQNTAHDLTDGAAGAKLNVAKTGPGTWTLNGTQTFSGDVTAREGTLRLKLAKPAVTRVSRPYKWFRMSFAKIGNGQSTLYLREVALYSADGARQNKDLAWLTSYAPDSSNQEHVVTVPQTIAAGQAGWDASCAGRTFYEQRNGKEFGACFSDKYGGDGYICMMTWQDGNGAALVPVESDRSTWISFVMHLRDDAQPVTHFDLQGFGNHGSWYYWPTRIVLEGSLDGHHWDTVFNNATEGGAFDYSSTGGSGWGVTDNNVWLSDGTNATTARHTSPLADNPAWQCSATEGLTWNGQLRWYRLWIAELGGKGNFLQMRQIGLYDEFGVRQNGGLTFVETPAQPGRERTLLGTPITAPGQVGYDPSVAGMKVKVGDASNNNTPSEVDAAVMATGGFSGEFGRFFIYWKDRNGNNCAPRVSDRSTWIPIVMRLRDDASAVTHFDLQGCNNTSLNYVPRRFVLEGSDDGRNWATLYDNTQDAEPAGATPTGYNQWLSDASGGTSRPAGKGYATSATFWPGDGDVVDSTRFANIRCVQALPGATLEATGPLAVSGLGVDASGGGTLVGFSFTANGILNVTGDIDMTDLTFTGTTYKECTGLANIANWSVWRNGHPSSYRIISVDEATGTIRIRPCGTMMIFR